jgi:hypothetical protein
VLEKIQKTKRIKNQRARLGIEPAVQAHKAGPEPLSQQSLTRFAVKILFIQRFSNTTEYTKKCKWHSSI